MTGWAGPMQHPPDEVLAVSEGRRAAMILDAGLGGLSMVRNLADLGPSCQPAASSASSAAIHALSAAASSRLIAARRWFASVTAAPLPSA